MLAQDISKGLKKKMEKGECIDSSLLDSQISLLANIGFNYLATHQPIEKLGNCHPNMVPYQTFPIADQWIIIEVGSEKQWHDFVAVLALPELVQDERFATNALAS
ncbi:MAG: CoA transferase [Proteobacteria bacterium]|nr:CoA transferase [Pseudomonadota bacterium]